MRMTVLLAHAHPGVKGKQQVRQKLRKSILNGLSEPLLLVIGEKPYTSVTLRFATDTGSRIALDILLPIPTLKTREKVDVLQLLAWSAA